MNEQLAAERQQQTLTALQNPMELNSPLPLRPMETVSITDYGVEDKGYFDTKYSMPDGGIIEGVPSLSIQIGGDTDFATIQVLDLSHNPMGEFGDEYLRQAGKGRNGEPISSRGNFAILLTDKSGKPVEFHHLERSGSWHVGRNGIGKDWLPDTVSREHLTIGIDKEGKLQVENHEPTNSTTISKPEERQTPENRNEIEQLNLGFDVAVDLANAEPLADEAETADKLGLVGAVVVSIEADYGAADAVIIRRETEDHGLAFSLARKRTDGSYIVTPIKAGTESILRDVGNPDGAEIGITIDETGKLTTREDRSQAEKAEYRKPNFMRIKRQKVTYHQSSPDLPSRPPKPEVPSESPVQPEEPYGHQILVDGHVVRGLIVPGRNEVMTSQGIVRTRETPRLR